MTRTHFTLALAALAALGLAAHPQAAHAQQTLYVSTANDTIDTVSSAGAVSPQFAADTNGPQGLAFDTAGNLYAANFGNSTIEKFTSTGVASTFATEAANGEPEGLAFDAAGNLYAANYSSSTIEEFNKATGAASIFATEAANSYPEGLAFDAAGNLYAANAGSSTIEKFTSTGAASTFATDTRGPYFLAFSPVSNASAAPEPSEWAALGFTGLGIGTLLLRARKRQAA